MRAPALLLAARKDCQRHRLRVRPHGISAPSLSGLSGRVMVQVGVVCKGVPFPFWLRGQAVLTLRVVSAAPEDVVRLAPGAEVSIAPRPRVRPKAAGTEAAPIASADQPSGPPAWFRIQVGACPIPPSCITHVCSEQCAEATARHCTISVLGMFLHANTRLRDCQCAL